MVVSAFGQAGPARRKTLPDFDVRDGVRASVQPAVKPAVERRRAGLETFLAREHATKPEIRIVAGANGLPKLFLRDGKTLSGPSNSDPETNARDFLRDNSAIFPFTAAEFDNLRLIVKDVTPDAAYVSFNQTLNGIDVFNAQIKVTLSKSGEVVQVATGDVIPGLSASTSPKLTHEQAVRIALRASGNKSLLAALDPIEASDRVTTYHNPVGSKYSPLTSELVLFPMDGDSARLAYRVFAEVDAQSWYELLVDAETGALLFRHNLYMQVGKANVWKDSPLVCCRQVVNFPDGWLPALPNASGGNGWVTTGNNADTFVDSDGDDKPDNNNTTGMQGGRAFDANANFDFPFGDGTVSKDPRQFKAASVTNLFYFVNAAHDFYYSLGFNEAAGNFQTDNFGKGGAGGDPVISEGQQAFEIDNASFAPAPDGQSPTMRVGIVEKDESDPTGDLDYDYSSQVIFHEYGHGVSSRLVGSRTSSSCLTGFQSQALSEGWSDYFAISYTNNPVMEAYGNDPTHGNRRQSYEGYTNNFEDIGTSRLGYEPHADGEIWAATLWDLRKLLGQQVTDQLVIDGLKSTPCQPTMIDARDGILTADQATNAGANRAGIWQIFAKHGMGFSAGAINGNALTGLEYDAAYDQPPDLQALKNPAITSKPLSIVGSLNAPYAYTVTATNPNSGVLKYALSSGPTDMTVASDTGKVDWVGSFTNQRVKITVTDGKGGKVVHGFDLPVFTTLTLGSPVTVAGAPFSVGYASVTVPSGVPVFQITTRGGTGDSDLIVHDPVSTDASQRFGVTNETITYVTPLAGSYQIEVHGNYSGVTLLAASVTPTPIAPNSTLTNLSGVEGSETMYVVQVPAGASSLKVSTSGGTGDLDLYVRQGNPAVCQTSSFVLEDCVFDNSSTTHGNNESVGVSSPAPGAWYIDLSGSGSYDGVTMTTALSGAAGLVVTPSSLSFNAVAGGASPASQSLAIGNPSGGQYSWTASASITSGGNWLSIDKNSGTGDGVVKVSAALGSLKTGTYRGTVTIASADFPGSPMAIPVTFYVTSTAPPRPTINSIGNAASYASSAVSPGEIVAIFGTGLGPATLTTLTVGSDGLVTKELAGTVVKFNGIAAPMVYTSAVAVACVVPYAVSGTSVQIAVTYLGVASDAFPVPIAPAVPGIFTASATGSGQAAAANQDLSANSPSNRAAIGSVITLYATGEGMTNPPGVDGKPAALPLPAPILPVTATIGGKSARVAYAGAAPGFIAGALQVNLFVPDGVGGPAVPVVISVGNASSQAATTIAVVGDPPDFAASSRSFASWSEREFWPPEVN